MVMKIFRDYQWYWYHNCLYIISILMIYFSDMFPFNNPFTPNKLMGALKISQIFSKILLISGYPWLKFNQFWTFSEISRDCGKLPTIFQQFSENFQRWWTIIFQPCVDYIYPKCVTSLFPQFNFLYLSVWLMCHDFSFCLSLHTMMCLLSKQLGGMGSLQPFMVSSWGEWNFGI